MSEMESFGLTESDEDREMLLMFAQALASGGNVYGEDIEKVYAACKALDKLDLSYEICGLWVWCDKTERTREHKEALKAAGFRWARRKGRWYFAGKPSTGRGGGKSMTYIRGKYGSQHVASDD